MRILTLATCLTLFASCGKEYPDNERKELNYIKSSYGVAYDLFYSNQDCTKSDTGKTLISADLFINGEYSKRLFDTKSSYLVHPDIMIGGEFYRTINDQKTHYYEKTIKAPVKFNPCFVEGGYESGSYEAAAISVIEPLQEFERDYGDLIKKFKIPQVSLAVAPKITENVKERVGKKTFEDEFTRINNAYYSPSKSKIVILPRGYVNGAKGNNPFSKVDIWKVPSISVHEYGHHLFRFLLEDSESKEEKNIHEKLTEEKPHLCIDNTHVNKAQGSFAQGSLSNEQKINKVKSAINEAFADLMGFYSDPLSRSYFGVGCMFNSRDVNSQIFINGDQKILTGDRINTYFDDKVQDLGSCLEDTNFTDPHLIGAIYAHSLFKVLNSVFDDRKDKVEFLMKWINDKVSFDKKTDPKQSLEKIALSFIQEIKKRQEIDKKVCLDYFKKFPTIETNLCE